jgi:hypothetical protein
MHGKRFIALLPSVVGRANGLESKKKRKQFAAAI